MTLVQRVLAYLEERQVPTALIGGMALAIHGLARATNDSDLLLTDERVLGRVFWSQWMDAADLDIRVGDADDPLAGVIALREGLDSVDLVVGRRGWMDKPLARRESVNFQGRTWPVVNRVDLVLLKVYAGGIDRTPTLGLLRNDREFRSLRWIGFLQRS